MLRYSSAPVNKWVINMVVDGYSTSNGSEWVYFQAKRMKIFLEV